MKKTKIITRLIATVLTVCVATIMVVPLATIAEDGIAIASQGKIVYDNPDGEDVVVDSEDLRTLARNIDSLKTGYVDSAIATANSIGSTPKTDRIVLTDGETPPTFNEIMEIIQNSQTVDTTKTIGEFHEAISSEDYELATNVVGSTVDSNTNISSATAENLSLGSAAWVDGQLVVGNGGDNKNYYAYAYSVGYAEGRSNTGEVEYIYHTHTGSASDGSGCYNKAVTHSHTGSCYKSVLCSATIYDIKQTATWDRGDGQNWWHYSCPKCGAEFDGTNPSHYVSQLTCGKTQGQFLYYTVGCGKTEGTIEAAIIKFD